MSRGLGGRVPLLFRHLRWRRTAPAIVLVLAALALSRAASGPLRPPPAVPGGPPAARVVSLVPSATELVVALGAADRLVARTRYDRPTRLDALPSVGGAADPDLEALLGLRPDLVVTWAGVTPPRVGEVLRAFGVAVHAADVQTVDDVLAQARALGRLLGKDEAAAALAEQLREGLAAVARASTGRPRPTVLLLLHPDPPLSAGPGTFLHELLERAGGRNAFDDAGRWPTLSVEAVVRRDPDALVVSARRGESAGAWLRDAPGWRGLRAVRSGRVLVLPADRVTHPGPGMVGLAQELAAFLHPGEAP